MIEAKFFTVGTYLYKHNLTVLFVSPLKIAHDKFYIYCPPLLLNEIYAHALNLTTISVFIVGLYQNHSAQKWHAIWKSIVFNIESSVHQTHYISVSLKKYCVATKCKQCKIKHLKKPVWGLLRYCSEMSTLKSIILGSVTSINSIWGWFPQKWSKT